jgi:hypothetical protein
MGFLKKLFGWKNDGSTKIYFGAMPGESATINPAVSPPVQPQNQPGPIHSLKLPMSQTEFPLQIVGESHYQEILESICGGRTEDGANQLEAAFLLLPAKNRWSLRSADSRRMEAS